MSAEQSGSDMSLTIAFKNEYGIKKLLSSMAKLKTLWIYLYLLTNPWHKITCFINFAELIDSEQ